MALQVEVIDDYVRWYDGDTTLCVEQFLYTGSIPASADYVWTYPTAMPSSGGTTIVTCTPLGGAVNAAHCGSYYAGRTNTYTHVWPRYTDTAAEPANCYNNVHAVWMNDTGQSGDYYDLTVNANGHCFTWYDTDGTTILRQLQMGYRDGTSTTVTLPVTAPNNDYSPRTSGTTTATYSYVCPLVRSTGNFTVLNGRQRMYTQTYAFEFHTEYVKA